MLALFGYSLETIRWRLEAGGWRPGEMNFNCFADKKAMFMQLLDRAAIEQDV